MKALSDIKDLYNPIQPTVRSADDRVIYQEIKPAKEIENFVYCYWQLNNANKPLFDAFPDIKFSIKELFGEGNKVITVYNWRGTHKNHYRNIPPTGKRITVEGINIYELRDGKVIDNVAKPDKFSFFQQLGLIPDISLEKGTQKK